MSVNRMLKTFFGKPQTRRLSRRASADRSSELREIRIEPLEDRMLLTVTPTISVRPIVAAPGTILNDQMIQASASATVNGVTVSVPGSFTFGVGNIGGKIAPGRLYYFTFNPVDTATYNAIQTQVPVTLLSPPDLATTSPQILGPSSAIITGVIDPGKSPAETYFQYTTGAQFTPTESSSIATGLLNPSAIAVDTLGNVYVAETGNDAIRMIPADGSAIRTIGSGFKAPVNVSTNGAGNIFVDDAGNGVIKQIFADGTIITLPSGTAFPRGSVTDPAGNLYELDKANGMVRKLAVLSIPLGTLIDRDDPISVAHTLDRLTAGATYSYRVIARNNDGFAVGETVSFVSGQQRDSLNESYSIGGGGGSVFLTKAIAPFASTPININGRPAIAIAGPGRSLSGYASLGIMMSDPSSARLYLEMRIGPVEFFENPNAIRDMTSADFNGDGFPDIAVIGELLTVITSNQNDFSAVPATLAVSFGQTLSVTAGDLNGDGRPEIVVSGVGGGIDVFVNNGDGTFANAVHLAGAGDSTSISIADINRDGTPDLIATEGDARSVRIYTGKGNATFNSGVSVGLGTDASGAVVMDLNQDQLLDMVVTSSAASTVTLWKNNGDGSFSAAGTYSVGVNPFDVKIGDVNGDGTQDLTVANRGTVDGGGSVSLLFGLGDMTFAPGVSLGFNFREETGLVEPVSDSPILSIELIDFMQDGRPEIVMTSGNGGIATITYNGPQFFDTPTVPIGVGAGAASNTLMETADVNSDGRLDVLAFNNNKLILYTNLGQGRFRQQVLRDLIAEPTGLLVTDMNGDGHQDILFSSLSYTYPLLNDGSGTFLDAGINYQIVDPYFIDVNSDGLKDLLGIDRINTVVVAFLNHGGGVFGLQYRDYALYYPDYFPRISSGDFLAAADLNNDGTEDFVSTKASVNQRNVRFGNISIDLSNGQGGYSSVVFPVPDEANGPRYFFLSAPLIADFDNDGFSDLAIRGAVNQRLFIYRNNGDGTFGVPVEYAFPSRIVSMDAGDFNGDGIMDIAVSQQSPIVWQASRYPVSPQVTGLSLLTGDGQGSFVMRHVGNMAGDTTIIADRFDSSGVDGIFTPNGLMKMITPTITLNQINLPTLATAGTAVGNITATTTGVGAVSYSLIRGEGDTDKALFSLSSNGRLTTAVALDGRVKPSYSIRVQTVDSVGVIGEQMITVSLKAVGLTNVVSTLRDDASTTARTKVADIQVSAISSSVNALSLSGPDASSFEIADGQLFLKAGVRLSFTKLSYNVTVNLDDASLSGSPDASVNYALTITTFVPTSVSTSSLTQDMTPTITWSSVATAVSYDVYLKNQDTNQVIQQNVAGASWTPSADLGIGRFRFWVRSVNSAGAKSAWSLPTVFTVNTAVTVPAQTLGRTVRPTVTWLPLAGAVSYEVWLNDSSRKITPLMRQSGVTSTSWTPSSDLALGTYTFWVRGVDKAGRVATWSAAMGFNVQAAPTPSSLMASTFSRQPAFTWTAPVGSASFVLTLANQTTGATQTISGITGTSWTSLSNLADGRWTWRVRAVSQFGSLTYWSDSSQMNVGGQPVVSTPTATRAASALFNWTAVSGAASYSLWLNRVDLPQAVIRRDGITSNSFSTSSPLAAGTYRVWVRAVSTTGEVSVWSSTVEFTVASSTISGENPVEEGSQLDAWQLAALLDPLEQRSSDETRRETRPISDEDASDELFANAGDIIHVAVAEASDLTSADLAVERPWSSVESLPEALTLELFDQLDEAAMQEVLQSL